jgi:hypothetical protein
MPVCRFTALLIVTIGHILFSLLGGLKTRWWRTEMSTTSSGTNRFAHHLRTSLPEQRGTITIVFCQIKKGVESKGVIIMKNEEKA